jgi:uncharacterized membrane protein YdbT with pleckstrin-like domain
MEEKITFQAEKPVRGSADEDANTDINDMEPHIELDANEKKLVRRMDFRILPVLVVVYIMAFIDR